MNIFCHTYNNTNFTGGTYTEQSSVGTFGIGIVDKNINTPTSVGTFGIVDKNINTPTLFGMFHFFYSTPTLNITISDNIIDSLPNKKLATPFNIIIEPDGTGFIVFIPEIPSLYGCGDTRTEAIEMLKREIESLYDDLIGDDNFTDEWNAIKLVLLSKIVA